MCRWKGGGTGVGLSGRAGGRLPDILWLVREAISIWGAVKAFRGSKPGLKLSVSERDLLEQEKKRRLQYPAALEKERQVLETQASPRLIEHQRPADC
jgi:hypothetical protein